MRTKPIVPSPRAAPYLATLRRVPDDIMLAVGSRDFALSTTERCVCGWVVREAIAKLTATPDAAEVSPYRNAVCANVIDGCKKLFGYDGYEWDFLFQGVLSEALPAIEEAFTLRVMEAAGVAKVA
ncbi:MAG: hypothetical protein ACHQWU_16810 [Gemmatimonadales bacterium]